MFHLEDSPDLAEYYWQDVTNNNNLGIPIYVPTTRLPASTFIL